MTERLLREWVSMMLVSEGGHAFAGVGPIPAADLKRIWPGIIADLERIGVKDVRAVGTTLMKDPANDIDVTGSYEGDRGDLIAAAQDEFGAGNVTASGSDTVSIAYPIGEGGKRVQVDVFIGNPEFIGWARSGVDPVASPIKAMVRNVLWNAVLRLSSSAHFPHEVQSDTETTRYVLDHDRGLFRARRRRTDPTKRWKTIEKEFVTDDPREIVRIMLGDDHELGDLATFESTVEALSSSPRTADLVGDALDDVLGALDSKQMKRKLGPAYDDVVARVRELAGR